MLFEFLHNINNITQSDHFLLTVAVKNYIQPKLYTCALCPADENLRARKGCRGELPQKIDGFVTEKCPGNYLFKIDYVLEYYRRWKNCATFDEQPAKLIDICYFIDNKLEAEKERLQKEADRRQRLRGKYGHRAKRRC